MGNFNLKSIWKQNGGTGGSTNLEQRVQAIENGYFKKEGGPHQIVRNSADFYGNIVLKQNGYVDNVDTNVPTSMINKQYLEQQLTTTKNQIRSENNTFTGTNTFNNQIVANEGLTTANEKAITSGNLELGLGNTTAYITPEDNSNKTLKFGGRSGRGRFNLDLETQSQLMGIKDPTADYHAVNKKYVDNKFKYVKKGEASNITVNANNYQSHELTINGLTTGLNEFYIVLTTSNVDIGFEVKIQCNNLNYPNMSEIKTISASNWQSSNIDQLGTIMVGFIQYGNNKFRMRMKNNHSSNITFNGYRVYHRIPGSIADN